MKVIIGMLAALAMLVLIGWGIIWHATEDAVALPEKSEAIAQITAAYPELQGFEDISLPPHRIEANSTTRGWEVVFLEEGSGVRGILSARCFFVDHATVREVGSYARTEGAVALTIDTATCKPVGETVDTMDTHPYGSVTLRLGETAKFPGSSIRPQRVVEDSRCPKDVECIWAGRMRVELVTVSGMGTSTDTLTLGDALTTEAERITFDAALPDAISTSEIAGSDYEFTFTVSKRGADEINPPITSERKPIGGCYIGGCSSQVCSDEPNMASTCEFRESYACYAKTSVCERQTNGQCGWSETSALTQCLAEAE